MFLTEYFGETLLHQWKVAELQLNSSTSGACCWWSPWTWWFYKYHPPQTSHKVGIFYFEIQDKIQNWDFSGFEMFKSFLKLLAKYQLSFLLQNIWKLTFSRWSCTGNVYKMKTFKARFLGFYVSWHVMLRRIITPLPGAVWTWNNYQFKVKICSIWICNKMKLTRGRLYCRFVVDGHKSYIF